MPRKDALSLSPEEIESPNQKRSPFMPGDDAAQKVPLSVQNQLK